MVCSPLNWEVKGLKITALKRESQTLSGEYQIAGILGLVAHTLAVTGPPLSLCHAKAAPDNRWVNGIGGFETQLYLWTPNYEYHPVFTGHEK